MWDKDSQLYWWSWCQSYISVEICESCQDSGDCFVIGALKVKCRKSVLWLASWMGTFWDIRPSSHGTPAESLCLWIWRTVDWELEMVTVVYCDRRFVAYLVLYIAAAVFYIIQNHKISLCHLFIYNVNQKCHKLTIIVQRSPKAVTCLSSTPPHMRIRTLI